MEDDNIREVFKIISHKIIPFDGVFFKIIWIGGESSWELLENLIHCDKALDNYYMKLDLIDDSSFLRRLVNIIRRNKKLPHDEGEFY